MKRSIISLIVLLLLVAIGAGGEVIHSNLLAKKIEDTIAKCEGADFDTRLQSCHELHRYFDRLEVINELFFTRKLINVIENTFSEIIVYAKYQNEEEFERGIEKLKIQAKGLYNAGVF